MPDAGSQMVSVDLRGAEEIRSTRLVFMLFSRLCPSRYDAEFTLKLAQGQ